MSMPTTTLNYSRFHAIVTARPLHAHGPPVIPEGIYRPSYEPWALQPQNQKRKTEDSDPGPSTGRKVTRRSPEDEGNSGRESTTHYRDRQALLLALKERFIQGPHVDFHGTYEILDPGVAHKKRVQTVAHEIWKATGYRFTVKDHPQFINGHKTRFWCSQDDAHRSKSSRAARKAQGSEYKPRTTSAGETMAKTRYPCRSRLLISSRDSPRPGTQIITIRMHHHLRHEPYIDSHLPPDVVKSIWDSFGKVPPSTSSTATEGDVPARQTTSHFFREEEEEEGSEEDTASATDTLDPPGDEPTKGSVPSVPASLADALTEPQSLPPPPLPTTAADDDYRTRMMVHIQNLRQFCDGLEYQLQFNDWRMLELLENQGRPFLDLVATCLSKEGRLVTPQNLDLPRQPPTRVTQFDSSAHPRAVFPSAAYESNPGINPRALGP